MRRLRNPISIYWFGLVILLVEGGIAWLSRSFVFGLGHTQRPILLFVALEFVAFGIYFAAVEWVRRLPSVQQANHGQGGQTVFWIILIGVLVRVVFLPSHLIQETDPYRYMWDGQTVLSGENPYRHSPREAFANHLKPSHAVTPEIQEVFRKINHAGIKTIYPPAAQFLFAVSQWVSPWRLAGWRLMILFAEIGIFGLMLGVFPKLGMRKEWLVLYAWCPLVIKEFSNSLHVDVFVVFFLALMVWAFVYRHFRFGFLALAFATGVKLFPLIFLPLAGLWTWHENRKRAIQGVAIFFAALMVLAMPFMGAEIALFEGLGRFLGQWRVNEGVFALIFQSVAQAPLLSLREAELVSRGIVAGMVVGSLAGTSLWLRRRREVQDYFRACLFVTAFLFFLAPTGNPWYVTWLFPFLYFSPWRSLVIFSGLVFLYYLDFYFTYRSMPHFFTWVRWLEYSVFYFLLMRELVGIWIKTQRSRLFCQWQMSGILSGLR